MSDLTVSITYPNFFSYTQWIAKKLEVKTSPYEVEGINYNLPKHPYRDTHIIFVPSDFLQPLPIALDWNGIAVAAEYNEKLRDAFDEFIRPTIEEVFADAKEKTEDELNSFKTSITNLVDIYRAIQIQPYNLKSDVAGFYGLKPYADSQEDNFKPSVTPKTQSQLMQAVEELLNQYKRGIENNAGNKLLYRKTTTGIVEPHNPHKEEVLQTIFYLIADLYCSQANIALHCEPNAGRGPVDFSLSLSYDKKVLIEMKKSNNDNILKGYAKQLEAYKEGEKAFVCYYVVVIVKKTDPKTETQLDILKKQYEEKVKNGEDCPKLFIIDGLIYPSPSKLK